MSETAAPDVEIDAQYRAMREEAAFVGPRALGVIGVSGTEAAEYLQGQLTQDIEAVAEEQGAYAALLDRKGHLQADMRVLGLGPHQVWLLCDPSCREPLLKHLSMYKIGRQAEVADLSGDHAVFSVIGPASAARLDTGTLAEGSHRELARAGVTGRAVATDLGIDWVVGPGDTDAAVAALRAADIEPATEEAAEIIRVESGRPRFGRELGPEAMPAEAGIVERAVSFTKGCYIGQEPVARLHYKGRPNRHLRGLKLSGRAEAGDQVSLGDRQLGTIGSCVTSPAHGAIALAILRKEAEPGAIVSVGTGAGMAEAEVVGLPFGG